MPINRIDQRLQHSAHECPHITTGIVGNFVEIGIVPILHLSSDRRFQAEYGTCGLSLRVADSTGSSSLTAGSRHGWPVCQYARGCVKRSATHHCGSACILGALRFASSNLPRPFFCTRAPASAGPLALPDTATDRHWGSTAGSTRRFHGASNDCLQVCSPNGLHPES